MLINPKVLVIQIDFKKKSRQFISITFRVVLCTLFSIIKESKGVIAEEDLRTWDSEDVLAVYDALVSAHESINKLALVPESF